MSTTVHRALTVKAARQLLNDTRGCTNAQINEAELLLRELQLKRPGLNFGRGGGTGVAACLACGGCAWSLHSDGDDEVWACDRCHLEPMSRDEARALHDTKRKQADRQAREAAAIAAAKPSLQEVLAAAEAKLAATRAEFAKVEAAVSAAQEREVTAQQALNAAADALHAARAHNVESQVAALLSGQAVKPRATVTEVAAVEVAVAGLEAATGALRLLQDRLADGRNSLHWTEYHRSNAARDVAYESR